MRGDNLSILMMKYLFCLLLLVGSFSAWSQVSDSLRRIKLYVKPMGDSVALRWVLADDALWLKGIAQGYDIYRKEIGGGVRKINDTAIKPISVLEWAYRNSHLENGEKVLNDSLPEAEQVALGMIYPDEMGLEMGTPNTSGEVAFSDNEAATRCFYHNVACLRSGAAAQISGLLYYDTAINPSEKYTYYLALSGSSVSESLDSANLYSTDKLVLPQPEIVKDFTNKKKAVLYWDMLDTTFATVASYHVFRSVSKNGPYKQMTLKPILALTDIARKDSAYVHFADESLKKGQTYYYKIQGKDVFGALTPFSAEYKVTEKAYLRYAPVFKAAINVGSEYNALKWEISAEDLPNVNHVSVLRSASHNGPFQEISPKLKAEMQDYIDKDYQNVSFYKIAVIGNALDTIVSQPRAVIIKDTFPPSVPVMVSAACDSLGVVRVEWKHGRERDLKQINLFRANKRTQEFSRIASIVRDSSVLTGEFMDTVFYDTISLRMLDDAVYYKVMAFDSKYNQSPFSESIKAFRYDTLPPNPPVIKSVENEDGYIELKWACSSSSDVVVTYLYKRFVGESEWHEFKKFGACSGDELMSVRDSSVLPKKKYEYALQSEDDAGLQSELSQKFAVQAYENGARPEIGNFVATANKRKHTVKLSWEYAQPGLEKFYIYKSKNQGKFQICASVMPSQQEFYDSSTGAGHEYRYKIKAIYTDGGESPVTDAIVVKY